MARPKMMKVTEHNRAMQSVITRRNNAQQQHPIVMDISYLKPLARWYSVMTETQKRDLPISILNALDSLYMVMKGRL